MDPNEMFIGLPGCEGAEPVNNVERLDKLGRQKPRFDYLLIRLNGRVTDIHG